MKFLISLFTAWILWSLPSPSWSVWCVGCLLLLLSPRSSTACLCLHVCPGVLCCCPGQQEQLHPEWDVRFPFMLLCSSSVSLRGTSKFSSLVHSEETPIIDSPLLLSLVCGSRLMTNSTFLVPFIALLLPPAIPFQASLLLSLRAAMVTNRTLSQL